VDHRPVPKHGQIEGGAVERYQLRLQFGNFVDERRDQVTFGSLANMWCAQCIDDPMLILPVGEQGTDTNDRMVDVLGKLFSQLRSDFSSVFPSRALAAANPRRSGTVSMSHTITCGIFSPWLSRCTKYKAS